MTPKTSPAICRVASSLLALGLLFGGCAKTPPAVALLTGADSTRILAETMMHRAEADSFFRSNPESPFLNDTSAHYDGIKWFPPDAGWYFQLPLRRYASPTPVTVYGTKGEPRKELRYGYFQFTAAGTEVRLNVYKNDPSDPGIPEQYRQLLSVWFTDETTGKETYEVGRYLEIGEELPDPDALYTLNFNNAYNPYCSYSERYSCAIPTKEDHLNVAVRAGERRYHP